jgi:hypothetical protein
MVMFSVAMPERIGSDAECQEDHKAFKSNIVNDINPKDWKGGENHGKHGTMNGTSD